MLDERGRETAAADRRRSTSISTSTREEDWRRRSRRPSRGSAGSTSWSTMPGCFSAKASRRRASTNGTGSAVNLTGVFLGTKHALPALRERAQLSAHGSAIVNLASVAGLVGSQLDPLYSMTKGGVTSVHQIGGARIRPQGLSDPGQLDPSRGDRDRYGRTRPLSAGRAISAPTMSTRPATVALETHPIGRLGRPEDIAKGIVFLASDDAGVYDRRRAGRRWRADRAITGTAGSAGASATATPRIWPSPPGRSRRGGRHASGPAPRSVLAVAVEMADLGKTAHDIDMGQGAPAILSAADGIDMPAVKADQHVPNRRLSGRRPIRSDLRLPVIERKVTGIPRPDRPGSGDRRSTALRSEPTACQRPSTTICGV